ncbi:dynactin subunit 2-A-like [Anneissia japonica]|uniref:dynactin subunit 2-A-like n=1 Tax=Anneissia japonica TaxID=1529436 RepID=UPI001425A9E9|nr:dynactin subunit 2-A-like [Anneissia japonica]
MADPKYENLPGIDNQPDVYETNDLPEDDQAKHKPDELHSESVEPLEIDTKDAFNRFKEKTLMAGSLDFSDRITQTRRTGYVAPKTEYELAEEGVGKETPLQKFQRLQHEMRELEEEVQQLQKTAKQEKDLAGLSPVTLQEQVKGMQEQLSGLHLENILGKDAIMDIGDPQGNLPKKLMSQLETYKKLDVSKGAKSPPKGQPTVDGHVTYELYYKAEQVKYSQASKVTDLEQRIARLEASIGTDPQKLSALTAETASKTLTETVGILQEKLSILEPIQVDHVDARLQSILMRLNQAKDKKRALDDADKDKKISELYDMVEKWNGVADTLPKVVERLRALKVLHEQALQFSQAMTHLDVTQQRISTSLQNQQTLLKELQNSFASNMAAIQSNCKSIDARLQKLKK